MASAVLLLALAAGSVSGQTSITITLNATTAGTTAAVLGVNLGAWPRSWGVRVSLVARLAERHCTSGSIGSFASLETKTRSAAKP